MKNKMVIIFSVLILGIGGYLLYDKLIQKKARFETNGVQEKEEDLNQVMNVLQRQVEESQVFKMIGKDYVEFLFTKENFERNQGNILAHTLTLLDEEEKYDSDETWNVISIEKLNQHLKNNYGINNLSIYPDMNFHGTNYKYDASERKYIAKQEYGTDADPQGIVPDCMVASSLVKSDNDYVLTLVTATIGDGFYGDFDKIYFDRYQTIEAAFNTQKLEKEFCQEAQCPLVQSKENRKILIDLLHEYVKKQKEDVPFMYQFIFKKNKNGTFYMIGFKGIKK